MIHTFADLCTDVYVLINERYRVLAAPYDHRLGPRAAFTESEVSTLMLVAALLGRRMNPAVGGLRPRSPLKWTTVTESNI